MALRILIVGGGAAGASAAARARKWSQDAEIHMFEAGSMITHAPCGIPYYVGGIVGDPSMLKTYTPSEFSKGRNVNVHVGSSVTRIDLRSRELEVEEAGSTARYGWDRLILATGARPLIPRVEGVDLKGVFTVRLPDGARELRDGLSAAGTVAVIGGGYIGLEMADAARSLGKRVLLFEAMQRVLPTTVDQDVAEVVHEELRANGVELHLSEPLLRLEGRGSVERVVTENGSYPVDAVVLAVGVRPDSALAESVGLRIGETGAVYVNEYMETSEPDVYAAGDLAETTHIVTGKRTWVPLAPPANKMGQVAGANSVSPRSLKFPGVVGTAVTKVFSYYVGRTGLSDEQAKDEGIDFESKLIKTRSAAEYYAKYETIYVKLTVERKGGRIIGGQIVSRDKIAAGYLDLMAELVGRGATLDDIFFSDLSYSPATAPVWHPVITAARVLSHGRL
ncbi:MAG: FAD-dependent oxidoreductase [Conexivisphaera sp.]